MDGRKWVPALAIVALLAGTACQRAPQAQATGDARPAVSPSPPVARSWQPFEPPLDGRLTPAQVEMYVAVRRRVVALSQASPAPGPATAGRLADLTASERRAVDDLGQDVDEYRWVSARVAEASPPNTEALGGLAGAIEAAGRKGREEALEKAAQERVPVAPSTPAPDGATRAYNRELLDRYRSELDALNAPGGLHTEPPRS